MIILDRDEIRRAVMRLSMEIIEKNKGTENLVLIGIRNRGAVLARKMRREIARIEGVELVLDAVRYRDDLSEEERAARYVGNEIEFSIDGKNVALIDDIMYTGRTVRASVSALSEIGSPQSIRLYTLIDRGHRELPFRPDAVGKYVPSSSEESVKVHFSETDGEEAVLLLK